MVASRFITFFTYMLRQNVIPFRKEQFVTFKMAPNIKKLTLYISELKTLIKKPFLYTEVFLKQIAMHVLVHVRTWCHIFVSFRQNGNKF